MATLVHLSAVHRTLIISEILSTIVSYTAGNRVPDIIPLARIRAFQEPVLDIIWHDIDGLLPLFKCLPDDSYTTDEHGYLVSIQSLCRRLHAQHNMSGLYTPSASI